MNMDSNTHYNLPKLYEIMTKSHDKYRLYLINKFGLNSRSFYEQSFLINLIDKVGIELYSQYISINDNTALIYACEQKMENAVIKLIDKFGKTCNPSYKTCHNSYE